MGRIIFEDELSSDFRFKRLVRAFDHEDEATGMLLRFWRMARMYWANDRALIPVKEFETEGFLPILKAGLAELRPGGIYAKGSEERFEFKTDLSREEYSHGVGQN